VSTGGSAGSAHDGGQTDASGDAGDAAGPQDASCPGGGTALSFDGSLMQFVAIPGNALPWGNDARTIEMWVLNKSPITNWAPDHTLFEYGAPNDLQCFGMDFDNVGNPRKIELYLWPMANSYFFDTGMMQDTWFHVAGSYDGSQTRAFVNGVQIGTGLIPNGPLATPSSQPLYIGSARAANYFTGSIDEVRVWNVARTAAEIARDFRYRLVGNEPGLVGYYRFDEGTGASTIDSTGQGNNGLIINGATYIPGVALGCR
jgi:hypothetical protein